MTKVDYKKTLKHLYAPSKKSFAMLEVPKMNFLMIDGKGNPNTASAFMEAIEALYSVSYTLKFMIKRAAGGIDYAVMPLEGLWWAEDMQAFINRNEDDWLWTLMIMQPEMISYDLVQQAFNTVQAKKNTPALAKIRFEAFKEGPCAQILYIGSYADEGPTIQAMHEYIEENGCERTGKHHEIYLSDPRRTAPEKLKTILRQPVRR